MQVIAFNVPVPDGLPKSNDIGNACLMQFNGLDAGAYLDRSAFVFAAA